MFWVQTHWCAGESQAGTELDLGCQPLAMGSAVVFREKKPPYPCNIVLLKESSLCLTS